MASEEELILWNREGWVPGPSETEEEYERRVQFSKNFYLDPNGILPNLPFSLESKIKKPLWSWVDTHLFHLLDLSPKNFVSFFRSEGLGILQGAVTWYVEEKTHSIRIPLIQCRKALKKGSFLKIYSLDEILSHEAVHAARVMFEDSRYEEIFAYWTSFNPLRRHLGPIMRSKTDATIFLILFSFCIFFQWLSFFFLSNFFSCCSVLLGVGALSYSCFGLFRLFRLKKNIKRAFNSLKKVLNNKKDVRAVLIRLTDEEIDLFSKAKKEEIEEFVKNQESFRWRLLRLAYFSKIK